MPKLIANPVISVYEGRGEGKGSPLTCLATNACQVSRIAMSRTLLIDEHNGSEN